MQTDNKILDDLAKMASGTAGMFLQMKKEIETLVKAQFDKMLAHMDLVTREEFDVVKDMAAKARAENEELKKRLDKLEKK